MDLYWYRNDSTFVDAIWSDLPDAIRGVLIGLFVMAILIVLTLVVLQIIGMVKTFMKANQKGWAAVIPFYNTFTIIKMVGLELWWFVVISMMGVMTGTLAGTRLVLGLMVMQGFVNYKLARSFGKGAGFAVGLTLLPPIFWMILGCSSDIKYKGPVGPYEIKYPKLVK